MTADKTVISHGRIIHKPFFYASDPVGEKKSLSHGEILKTWRTTEERSFLQRLGINAT